VTDTGGRGYTIAPGRGQFGDGGRGDNAFVYATIFQGGSYIEEIVIADNIIEDPVGVGVVSDGAPSVSSMATAVTVLPWRTA